MKTKIGNAGNRTIGVRLATYRDLERSLDKKKNAMGMKRLSWEQFMQMLLNCWKKSEEPGLGAKK